MQSMFFILYFNSDYPGYPAYNLQPAGLLLK